MGKTKTMRYAEYLNNYIKNTAYGEPIFTDEIADDFAKKYVIDIKKAKKTINVYLKRFTDRGILTRIRRGVYGKNKKSVFGKITPDKTKMLNDFFIENGKEKIGYLAGPALLNFLGISSDLL